MDEKLLALQAELKSYFEKAAEDQKKNGTVSEALNKQIAALQAQVDEIDKKMAAVVPGQPGETADVFEEQIKNDPGVQRLLRDKRGNAVINFTGKSALNLFERKTTISSGNVGNAPVSGVMPIGRLPGITGEARQQLTIRDLLSASPTLFQVLDFVKVQTPMTIASPVPEGSLKPENAVTFVTVSERIKTIATWIPATRQVLDDISELMTFIKTMMPYYVNLAEEQQILSGDGTGENLHGLIPQASPFSAALLGGKAYNKIDILGRAIQQITAAKELPPTFVVMHPNDWWDIRLTKDAYGRYILGDPQEGAYAVLGMGSTAPTPNIFGLTVDATTNIAPATFLVGSGNPIATEIRDRMEMQIDVSTEHQDFFTKNLVAIRAEKRLALITRRPASFVTGTFSTSP